MAYKAYKTELNPNNKQTTLFLKNAGTARFTYNWALDQKKDAFDRKEKIPSAIDLHRKLNILKQGEFSWMYESSKCSAHEALRNCDKAFSHFFRRCKQKKKGKKGFPKYKSKKNGIGSFSLNGTIKVLDKHIQLPRIGKVKLKEKNYLPQDKKIISSTISEKVGRWFVSVLVKEEIKLIEKQEDIIGLDLGINRLATCSDGEKFENHKALKKNLVKLKRYSRQHSKKAKGGKNREKSRKKLARLHYRISCIRKDCLHQTTTFLTKTKSKIAIEDLNVAGMMNNRSLARAIADVGWGEFRRQLEYKSKLYNCEIVLVNRFFPSSKMCSCCGNIKKDLELKNRVYKCEICKLEVDRDLNASINLNNYIIKNTDSSSGINAFGEVGSGLTLG